jgi:hypothetical protein
MLSEYHPHQLADPLCLLLLHTYPNSRRDLEDDLSFADEDAIRIGLTFEQKREGRGE